MTVRANENNPRSVSWRVRGLPLEAAFNRSWRLRRAGVAAAASVFARAENFLSGSLTIQHSNGSTAPQFFAARRRSRQCGEGLAGTVRFAMAAGDGHVGVAGVAGLRPMACSSNGSARRTNRFHQLNTARRSPPSSGRLRSRVVKPPVAAFAVGLAVSKIAPQQRRSAP
jgi:hypothetical protein